MNIVLKGLVHLFVSTAAVAGTNIILTGAPITSGNVLIPAVVAGALAVGHAAFPSIIGVQADGPPAPSVPRFPQTR